jgi:hypothetical protein
MEPPLGIGGGENDSKAYSRDDDERGDCDVYFGLHFHEFFSL